jgi:hypothetical protein
MADITLPEGSSKLTTASISITTSTLADATDMIWHKTQIRIYPVTDSKLEELTAGYNSIYLVFFGIFIGAAVSLFIAFKETAVIAEKPYYLAGFIGTLGVGILSGIAGITNLVRASLSKKRLYREAVPLVPKQ